MNKRNFTPVGVWKQVRRKELDSRLSMPVVGGRRVVPLLLPLLLFWGFWLGGGGAGFMLREMAWIPWKVPARMRASFDERFWRPGEKVRL